jgi:aspartyl-tRNA(Asn)/glutamyl-tRNA(Gln) amidotransferase subunit A
MTVLEAQSALRAGKVSSEELVRDSVARIERLEPELNAFITVTAESAIDRAREIDGARAGGEDCGELAGIPVALKDLFHVRGVHTTGGSKAFAGPVADFDSAVTEKLTAAGAVLIGKTGLHECAYGITNNNPHFGAVHNPWDTTRIPGGSSGGSAAAVAAGMVFAAMGTDTGGSIRIPSSYCGTVGLKPTFGRVSKFGVMPLGFSLDHMGPLTRTVRDAALLLQAIAGTDSRDDTSSRRPVEAYMPPVDASLKGLRIGWPVNFFFDRVQPDVASAVGRAGRLAEDSGAHVITIQLPDMQAMNTVGRVILLCEASAVLGRVDRESLGEDVRLLVEQGLLLAATDYIDAQRLRRIMQRAFSRIWEEVDCFITPATPITAPPIGATEVEIAGEREDVRMASTRFARALNVLGLHAISIPCGLDDRGMPIGLQIISKAFSEAQLLHIAAGFEQLLGLGELIAI